MGLVRFDRESFHDWYPRHLVEVMELVDHLYIRIGDDPNPVLLYLEPYEDRVSWEPQFTHYGRFQEDAERNALLDYALQTGADWCVVLDSDEVLEETGGKVLRQWMLADTTTPCFSLRLHYSSHHRPGYILPSVSGAYRAFRLDDVAKSYRYKADEDGLHCGTVPGYNRTEYMGMTEPRLIHYHATSPEEWLQEREFYDDTAEVRKHGGIDWLYPLCGEGPPWGCDFNPRFGKESEAFPLGDLAKDREQRFASLMAEPPPEPNWVLIN